MTRPNIQIGDEIREMTEEEYQALVASGWTEEAQPLSPSVTINTI